MLRKCFHVVVREGHISLFATVGSVHMSLVCTVIPAHSAQCFFVFQFLPMIVLTCQSSHISTRSTNLISLPGPFCVALHTCDVAHSRYPFDVTPHASGVAIHTG